MKHLNLIDLAKPSGRDQARAVVSWVDVALGQMESLFGDAADNIRELAPALGFILLELSWALDATIGLIETEKVITDEAVNGFNRAYALQQAALNLLNHLQRHSPENLEDYIPVPTKLRRECTCGQCPDAPAASEAAPARRRKFDPRYH